MQPGQCHDLARVCLKGDLHISMSIKCRLCWPLARSKALAGWLKKYLPHPVTCLESFVCLQTGESINELTLAEDEARKKHAGIWIHGDPGSESDDEDAPPQSAWGRR